MALRAVLVILLFLAVSSELPRAAPLPPSDPAETALQQRLQSISDGIRCLVCQEESLFAARADLAQALRNEIRTMIRQGQSDQEIIDALVARYSDFVHYRPSFAADADRWAVGLFFALVAAGMGIYLLRGVGRPGVAAPDTMLAGGPESLAVDNDKEGYR